jgi:NAD(P)-dependent dehydrogenase (short-subunit alcohol dehydrogenase family)
MIRSAVLATSLGMLTSKAVCLNSIWPTRTILVTGSTDGIGLTTAKRMAEMGYNVMVHGRDQGRIDRANDIVQQWIGKGNGILSGGNLNRIFSLPPTDISTINGCRELVRHVSNLLKEESDLQLTILMNNAGVFSERLKITADGLEETFAVNVMAPFVITSLLLPSLLKEPNSRIVVASSISQCQSIQDWDDLHYQTRSFSSHRSYSESKLFDAMLTMEMAERLQTDGKLDDNRVTCNCLDPGTVNTKMLLAGWAPCGIDVENAQDETWLCSSGRVDGLTGRYFVYRTDTRASSAAYSQQDRTRLWTILSEIAPDAAAIWKFDWL